MPEIQTPRPSVELSLGVVSPLWPMFAVAASAGAAWWWMSRLTLGFNPGPAANLEGALAPTPVAEPKVELVESPSVAQHDVETAENPLVAEAALEAVEPLLVAEPEPERVEMTVAAAEITPAPAPVVQAASEARPQRRPVGRPRSPQKRSSTQ